MGLIRILVAAGGLALSAGCTLAIYLLINMILSGAFSGVWIQVIAGGLLLYLFLGVLGAGFLIGLYLIIAAITGGD